ncbi:hypothetical protein BBJ28_00016627 [Nothophytophthora sp. Chile5]|nr:hypothetical protein BBJ28_00016627 [Nothophytophthora sp. Chile5]
MGLAGLMSQVERVGAGVGVAAVVMYALWTWQQAVLGAGSKRLQDFRLVRVLKTTDTELALLGNFASDRKKKAAVIVIQTAPLNAGSLSQLLVGLSLHEILLNDIYSTYQGDVPRDIKPFKINVIYPATEGHVRKHTDQKFHMVVETKEAYRKITKPHIDSIPAEKLEWVYNILEQNASLEVLSEKFGVRASSVRMYVHYQPTYYHLHVHFSHVKMIHGTFTGKAVLLEDIIYNLSCSADHYKNATLSFVVGEMQHKPLFELFREKHII